MGSNITAINTQSDVTSFNCSAVDLIYNYKNKASLLLYSMITINNDNY